MKYRVRVDLSFDPVSGAGEAEAQSLMNYTKGLADRAVSINEGSDREEISFCDMEICRHDEGLPCTRLDRIEVRNRA